MATLLPLIKARFFTANGIPLVGGKVYSYIAGTSTPFATFTDSTGAVPNANPVVLDANGEADIWLGAGSYKFIVKDSGGVTLYAIDDVVAASSDRINALSASNLSDGAGLFLQRLDDDFQFKSLKAMSANITIVDYGDYIGFDVPGGPASTDFAIEFVDHAPTAEIKYRTPRGSLAEWAVGEDIASVDLITIWPSDNTELKVGLDIRIKGLLASTVTPAEAQLFYMDGTLHIDREVGAFVAGTPFFDGDASSGMKISVGSVGGFIAVKITFRLAALAREVTCIVSGTSYSEDNTDTAVAVSINGTALTGPTDCAGCSGIVAFNLIGETSQPLPCFYEFRGKDLYLTGQSSKVTGWSGNSVIYTFPPNMFPRNTDCFRGIFTKIGATFDFRAVSIDAATGNMTLIDFGSTVLSVNLTSASPMPIRVL